MNKLRKLLELSSSTKKLLLLTMATLALAVPALATSDCTGYSVSCPDGTQTGALVCCGGGQSSYAECDCATWSQSGGWSDCFVTTLCYQ